jgi:hypothetical protein
VSEILVPGARIDRTAFRGSGPHGSGKLRVITLHVTTGPPGSIDGSISHLHAKGVESHSVIEHRASQGREHVQLVDGARASKSLKNLPGGSETNRAGVNYQVELVGPAEDPVVDTTPDDWRWLGGELAKIGRLLSIPAVAPFRFYPYLPTRWDPPQFLGREFWRTLDDGDDVQGWVGHQHWVENAHGDPGDLSSPDPRLGGRSPISLMLEGAGATTKDWFDNMDEKTFDKKLNAALDARFNPDGKGNLLVRIRNSSARNEARLVETVKGVRVLLQGVAKLLRPVAATAADALDARAAKLDERVGAIEADEA